MITLNAKEETPRRSLLHLLKIKIVSPVFLIQIRQECLAKTTDSPATVNVTPKS